MSAPLQGRRVCLITRQYPPQIGGVGHSTQRVARMLSGLKLDLHVVVIEKEPAPVVVSRRIDTSMQEAITLHRVRVWDKQDVDDADNQTHINRELFEVLNQLQNQYRFELFHGFFLYPAGFGATNVARYHGVKSIVSIRGNDVGKYGFDPSRHALIEATLKNADYVTSVASSLIEFADRTICSIRQKSSVILNSIDLEKTKSTSPLKLPLEKPVIGTLGLFRYKKGLVYLFEALKKLSQEHPFSLLLIGDFFNEAEAHRHLEQLERAGLSSRTTITGRVAHDQVADYLPMLDMVAFPSLFSEGCPLSLLEAMSAKKPILASKSGTIPEVLEHQVSGWLTEPGSVDEIYQGLKTLLNDPELARQLGKRAYEKVVTMTPEAEACAWQDVYRKVLDA